MSNLSVSGMTLRDWFAGQALAGMLASESVVPACDREYIGDFAYSLADSMVKAREADEKRPERESDRWEKLAESYRLHGNKMQDQRDELLKALENMVGAAYYIPTTENCQIYTNAIEIIKKIKEAE